MRLFSSQQDEGTTQPYHCLSTESLLFLANNLAFVPVGGALKRKWWSVTSRGSLTCLFYRQGTSVHSALERVFPVSVKQSARWQAKSIGVWHSYFWWLRSSKAKVAILITPCGGWTKKCVGGTFPSLGCFMTVVNLWEDWFAMETLTWLLE